MYGAYISSQLRTHCERVKENKTFSFKVWLVSNLTNALYRSNYWFHYKSAQLFLSYHLIYFCRYHTCMYIKECTVTYFSIDTLTIRFPAHAIYINFKLSLFISIYILYILYNMSKKSCTFLNASWYIKTDKTYWTYIILSKLNLRCILNNATKLFLFCHIS